MDLRVWSKRADRARYASVMSIDASPDAAVCPTRRHVLRISIAALSAAALPKALAETMTIRFDDPEVQLSLRVVNDGVMGGTSRSAFVPTAGGIVFSGTVSLENNGGFASLRGPLAIPSSASTLVLTARGDGKRYKLILRTAADPGSPIHQCDFIADDSRTHRFTAEGFKATFRGRDVNAPPLVFAQVVEFGILIADQQAGAFRIQLERLQSA